MTTPGGDEPGLPAQRESAQPDTGQADKQVVRTGMFGVHGTPDTSGYGGLQVHKQPPLVSEPPYGGYFDAVAQALGAALSADGSGFAEAVERVVVDRGELTFYVRREHLLTVADKLLHDPALRFEIFSGVSGVHYPDDAGQELSAVYHLVSITHNRRLRLEVRTPDADPHIPSVTPVYPAANWHERETWDFFGIVFDGHPALTRIQMPDDWRGHPQRKDYPLGGIAVEYRGTKVPPPDEKGVLVSTETHATPGASDAEAEATEGRVYNVAGGDWDEIVTNDEDRGSGEQIVVNMGPQHPSTHGVLRLILTLEGETVTDARASIGYLHTGIEKSMEYRTWTQGTTFITRADYLMPLYNEVAYCLSVERLLGIEDKLPERAKLIRVLLLELNRISSHLGGIGPFGMELGATTIFLHGLRMRENILDIFESITGLRMNHAFIRPGGVAQDIPAGGLEQVRDFLRQAPKWVHDLRTLIDANPVFVARTRGVAYLDLEGCMALGVTGPMLRATGLPWDLRKSQPYLDYETYDFDVPTTDTCDTYGRYIVRIEEIEQSLRLVRQVVDRLADRAGVANDPWLIQDAKIGWPARLSLGPDGMGPSPEHIAHIMGQSMEALIHHFKLVTEGFRVPAGQAYVPIESPKGELACHLVSDGGTRPYRAHLRDPSFHHMQAVSVLCEGGNLADVIPAIASIDPVIGGVDR